MWTAAHLRVHDRGVPDATVHIGLFPPVACLVFHGVKVGRHLCFLCALKFLFSSHTDSLLGTSMSSFFLLDCLFVLYISLYAT